VTVVSFKIRAKFRSVQTVQAELTPLSYGHHIRTVFLQATHKRASLNNGKYIGSNWQDPGLTFFMKQGPHVCKQRRF